MVYESINPTTLNPFLALTLNTDNTDIDRIRAQETL